MIPSILQLQVPCRLYLFLFPTLSSTKALFSSQPLFFTPDLRFAAWLLTMAPRSRPVGPDNKSESDASSDVSEIFSDNGSGSESNSDLELDSDDSDDDEDPNDNSVDDEGQMPPEHYLAEAESLEAVQRWHPGKTR
jgi:hypothetical protein